MAVSYRATSKIATNLSDNLCRWNGAHAGHYEVWFVTLNHRASKHGFWFRYTLSIPDKNRSSEHAKILAPHPNTGLWAAAFDHARPEENFALKCEYDLDRFEFDREEGFRLKICEGVFSPSHASGQITNEGRRIAWDLSFVPNNKTYHHVTRAVKMLARPSSFICSPNLDARFTGVINVDGREFILEDEPGCQSHLWGRKRTDEWVWVHSNAFENRPDTVFEGLAARSRVAGRTMPPLLSLFLRHRGEDHHFTRVRMAEQWRRNLGIGFWAFSAMNSRIYIEGTAQCRMKDMLQVEYDDPDGERLYCLNSEVANLKIRIFRRFRGIRWRHVETIKARSTAHLEHAARQIDPLVRMAF